uniref:Methyltransferase n=1 Tax=Staphylothermus marinus TaxID=2280 RepID=A0A7C4D6C1_STAMA
MYENVYEPSEDTWFLLDIIEKRLVGGKQRFVNCIDLGCGTGVLGLYLLVNNICERVFFIDSSFVALENTFENILLNNVLNKSILINTDVADLKLINVFDLVVANPPYLPGKPSDLYDTALLTGINGFETIVSFIETSYRLLRKHGLLYLVYSSLSRINVVENTLNKKFKVINKFSKKFFLEELYVIEALRK